MLDAQTIGTEYIQRLRKIEWLGWQSNNFIFQFFLSNGPSKNKFLQVTYNKAIANGLYLVEIP